MASFQRAVEHRKRAIEFTEHAKRAIDPLKLGGDGDGAGAGDGGGAGGAGDAGSGDQNTATSTPTSASAATTPTSNPNNGNPNNGGGQNKPTSKSTTTTAKTSAAPSTTAEQKDTETETATSLSAASSTTKEETSSATEESIKTSATAKTTATPAGLVGKTTATNTHTVTSPGDNGSDDSQPTISPSSTPAASGSLNTGAVVGGIAGGLVAVAVLAALIAFFIRRYKRRSRSEEFDAAQFRRSAMIMDESRPTSLFGGSGVRPASIFGFARPGATSSDARPPSFFARAFHRPAASVNSTHDAGMAGQGAFRYQQNAAAAPAPGRFPSPTGGAYQANSPYHDTTPQTAEYNEKDYQQQGQDPFNQQEYYQDQPNGARALQPRQQYTFGQEAPASNGAGQAYVVDGGAGYQGEGHYYDDEHLNQYDEKAGGYNLGDYHSYAPETPPAAAAPASHSRPLASGQHGARPVSAIDEDDAYGGM